MNQLVSVVVPTYNHAHLLSKALSSVLDQTYPYWELLVIDNHSHDNTTEVVNSFCDSRIRLLKIHNQGVIAVSRNLGIREARGEWIAFLDSDDCWYPKKLEIIMRAVEFDNTYDVLSNDELMVDIRTGVKKVLRYGPYQKDFYKTLLIEGNRLSPSATIVRHEFLTQHGIAFEENADYITVEDYGLWLKLAHTGARFKFIHDVQGEYVIHGDNNSAHHSHHWGNCERLLHDHVFHIQRFHPSPDRLWKLVFPRLRMVQVRYFVLNSQIRAALMLALETFYKSPIGTTIYLLSKLKRNLRK
jgi:glycosyltransferase involved in cell wall biosynthesis